MNTAVPEHQDESTAPAGTGRAIVLPPIVVMVADRLGVSFIDGDDLHPESNRLKMAAGTPLDDADRAPWLAVIGRTIADSLAAGDPVVVACSALKRSYRDSLRAAAPSTVFALPTGDPEVLVRRLAVRQHEFMPRSLLDSQLATLEPFGDDEAAVEVDFADAPEESARLIVERVRQRLGR
jgi:gluconokinase